jgi:amylosucrase
MLKEKITREILNKGYSGEFLYRFGKNFGNLYDNFEKLYGDKPGFEEHVYQLVNQIYNSYETRKEDLKVIDRKREDNPSWYMGNDIVGTMIYTDRYNKDLKGFTKKIDHLKDMGINYVHLMPLLDMSDDENDGGYAVKDFKKVYHKFGTTEDLIEVADELHKRDMLMELDIVLNHTADIHEWAMKAKQGDPKYINYYYFYDNREIPDEFERTLPEVFPDTAPGNFTYVPELDKWVMSMFYRYQWDLNYTNPEVFVDMIDIISGIANFGMDILRLDAVPFLWKKIGTISRNEEQAHIILRAMKAAMRMIAPGVLFKAEAIVEPYEIVRYLGEGKYDECEIAYNASFMVFLWDAIATRNARIVRTGLNNMARLPKGTTWINYVRCHDDIGLGHDNNDIYQVGYTPEAHRKYLIDFFVGRLPESFAQGVTFMENPKTGDARISGTLAALTGLEKGVKENNSELINDGLSRIKLLHTAIMCLGGIPLIYYGDEVGHFNNYGYKDVVTEQMDSRWIHRPVIDWDKMAKKDVKGTVEYEIYQSLKSVIKKRSELPEFTNENDFEILDYSHDKIFSFLRQKGNDKTVVLVNFSENGESIALNVLDRLGVAPNGYYDYLTGEFLNITNSSIHMNKLSILWVKVK